MDGLARAGVRRARVKLPVPVPPTNAWYLGRGEVTLIDCGLLWGDAMERLREPLEAGERIARILVTHGHPDHHGAAAALSAEHGCRVLCHPFDSRAVREYRATLLERFSRWAKAAAENGMPEVLVAPMEEHYRRLASFGADVARVERINDGDRVEAGGIELDAIHVPGHTAGSLVFLARRQRLLFSGDTVLPGITPNPFFEGLFDEASGPGPFLESLRRLRGLNVDVVLPGHGDPLRNLGAVLDSYERHHADRRSALVECLTSRGGATGFEVVETLFPNASGVDRWLAMAEVLGHLQHLEALGEAQRFGRQGGVLSWRAAP